MGTLIDAAGICAGGTVGLLFGRIISNQMREQLLNAAGIVTMFMGIAGAMSGILTVENGALTTKGTMMLLIVFVLGTFLGELADLEGRVETFGDWIRARIGATDDPNFTEGFVTTSLTVGIGAMAIVGSINDGANGDLELLIFKALFDAVVLVALSSALGKGCLFCIIPVIIVQESITLFAKFAAPLITPSAIFNISMSGAILIFCIGYNLVFGKKFKIMNMVPALLLATIWAYLPFGLA